MRNYASFSSFATAILLLKLDLKEYTAKDRKWINTLAELMSPSNHFQSIRRSMEASLLAGACMIPCVCPYLQDVYRLEHLKQSGGFVDGSPLYQKLNTLANLPLPRVEFSLKHQNIMGCLSIEVY
jgi:hypothetical protein